MIGQNNQNQSHYNYKQHKKEWLANNPQLQEDGNIKIYSRVIDYINKEFKKGYKKKEIAVALSSVGYNVNLIKLHFNYITKKSIIKSILIFVPIVILITFVIDFIL